MNCTKCNTPGAPHELIDGLCHSCTAKELQRYKDKENEVCEWHKSPTAFIYHSSCHKGIVVAANDFIYCQYCGKMIKLI